MSCCTWEEAEKGRGVPPAEESLRRPRDRPRQHLHHHRRGGGGVDSCTVPIVGDVDVRLPRLLSTSGGGAGGGGFYCGDASASQGDKTHQEEEEEEGARGTKSSCIVFFFFCCGSDSDFGFSSCFPHVDRKKNETDCYLCASTHPPRGDVPRPFLETSPCRGLFLLFPLLLGIDVTAGTQETEDRREDDRWKDSLLFFFCLPRYDFD